MKSLSAGENARFIPDIPQSGWAFVAAKSIAEARGGEKASILFFEKFSDCEIFYPRIAFFLKFFGADYRVKLLPPPVSGEGANSAAFDALCERTGTLNALAEAGRSELPPLAVLTTPEAFFSPAPSPGLAERFEIRKGGKISIDSLSRKLAEYGYYNEVLCESPGQFSVRGGIVDVYPIASTEPYRIDFFGDEIDSLRTFDPDTQLGTGKAESFRIDAIPQDSGAENGRFTCADYLKGSISAIFFEPRALECGFPERFSVPEKFSLGGNGNFSGLLGGGGSALGISSTGLSGETFRSASTVRLDCEDMGAYSRVSFEDGIGFERFESWSENSKAYMRRLSEWSASGMSVYIAASGKADEELAEKMISAAGIKKFDFKFVPPDFGEGFLVRGAGFGEGVAFVGQRDFFGRRPKTELEGRRKMLSRRAQVDQMLDFSELGEGDYVVHLTHGVCRYHGVVKLKTESGEQEVMKLEFEDGASLYLPLHNAHLLTRYIGLDKRQPKLAKLNSKAWTKVKTAAELAALDYAAELLEIQSRRELAAGKAFPPDDDWQRNFDGTFPYVETPDQLRAIEDVKRDMESPRPMDRLICADVGFGKTEVAMRAAFKCVLGGAQAAVLCPTTILCQQHFRTFGERFRGYPVVVEMLSRFRTPRQAAKIKAELAAGKIDVIIGTHALLADDVSFKNLGLLVVDEEHRFGVKHKEKIKKLRSGIDVLSMSATPIPRTLYFAMMGAREISVMETPPKNRFPVETFVREYSEETVRKAVEMEIGRGGQVFYLHNRVKSIDETAEKLRAAFPNLRIGVGHGRMDERALEKLMADFVDGRYDILVCTTIIESGLDIPNCNTIIIEGADKFGLAQLYQLRGRVGRFTRRAYAWLLLHRHASLVESARKRLGAIRQYNKPGAGFRIATRDLQLRGCGNLLGAKQSGHIAGVGFDLYCALLKRSIALLRGERPASVIRAVVDLDFISMGEAWDESKSVSQVENYYQEIRQREMSDGGEKVSAYIPASYIPQTRLRLDIYRQLAMAASMAEIDSRMREIIDRFGRPPKEVGYLIGVSRVRVLAESAGFTELKTEGKILKLGERAGENFRYFKLNGNFLRLTKLSAAAKLREIEHILTVVVPSIRKT